MNFEEQDQLRRALRAAIFRAERLRTAGHSAAADELLSGELAAAQGRLAAGGTADASALVHLWYHEDEAAFALAQLIGELVGERIQSVVTPTALPAAERLVVSPSPAPPLATTPAGVPGLADLLDGMFTEERRAKRRPA